MRLVSAGKAAGVESRLIGYDFHFYQFIASPGQAYEFCTDLNGDGDCEDAGDDVGKVDGKDTVLEIWGPNGKITATGASDDGNGESQVRWTPRPGEGGVYYLFVRGGFLCGGGQHKEPCDGKYTVRYTIPRQGVGVPLHPFAHLVPDETTSRSVKLVWPPGKGVVSAQASALTPEEFHYEVRKNGVTILGEGGLPLRVTKKEHTFEGLSPGTAYDLGVRLVLSTPDIATDWVDMAVMTLLKGPTDVSYSAGATYVHVSWNAVGGANEYALRHRSGEGSWMTVERATSPSLLRQLSPGTEYEVQVRARFGGVWTDWSESLHAATDFLPMPQPTNLQVDRTQTTVTLSWEEVPGATAYKVKIVDSNGDELADKDPGLLPATVMSYPFTGLTPGASYVVSVRARATQKESEWSTIDARTDPVPAINLRVYSPPSSCETDERITIQSFATGGNGSYLFTVDGKDAQTQESGLLVKHQVQCQSTAGQQTFTVAAADPQFPQFGDTETLTVAVTQAPVTTQTVTAMIRAQRLADDRVEYRLRLKDGTEITPVSRYWTPAQMTDGDWDDGEPLSAAIGGKTYPLGQVSVRLDNTVCPAMLEFTFLPADGERITPTTHRFAVSTTAGSWQATSEFDLTVKASSSQRQAAGQVGQAPPDEPGGADGAMAARADGEQAGQKSQAVCTAVPSGLDASMFTSTSITLQWGEVTGASQYDVKRNGMAEEEVTAATSRFEFDKLQPSTQYTLEVRARSWRGASEWASIKRTTASIPPLTLNASASPTSCETGGEVTVSWMVTGGSGTHTVTVDGVGQSGSSTTVDCQAEPGAQTVNVTATDQAAGVASVTKQLRLTVTKAASQTMTAQIRARRLSDNRVEFQLRLGDGTDLTTAERFMNLPVVVAGRWYSSGAFTTAIDGTDYRLGVVSAQLDNTVCPAQVWVTFLPTEGERISPTRYKLPVDREANLWATTSKFEITLVETPPRDAVRQGGAVDRMDAAPEGASLVPGREGGLMLGDEAPADAQRRQSVKTCVDAPTGLAASNLTSSSARLSWGKVAAASEYDVAVGDGASTQLASSKTSYDFSGLAADTSHTLKVRARSWRGASEWSSKVVRTKVSPVPVITIAAGASPVDEGANASFTVTSNRTLTTALEVKLSVTESGAMISGTAPSQVTIAQGATAATLSVATRDDEQDEDDSLVTATLLAGAGYQLGSAKSAVVTVADDDGQGPQLTLTLTSSSNSCETDGQVTVGWTVSGGSGTYTVTVDGTSQSGASATVTCQATAGTQTVTVVVTDKTDTTLTKTETLDLSVTVPPLTLAAKASPTSCDTGGQVTVSWTVGGGSGAYSVTVDGAKQSGSSTTVSCQATAGTQTVSVVATDKADTKRTKTQQLTLTVTKPPGTVTATLRARRLTDNRFELGLRLADGTDVSVTKRFANPPSMTSGAWKQSEALSATIEGRSYSLGQISVRLENDRCPSRLELSFLPASGSRSSPQQRFLRTNVKAETWFSGSEFTITLSRSDSLSAQQSTDNGTSAPDLLDDTPDATNAGPGTEGGSLSGETPSPVPDALAQADAQSSGTPVCPSAPSGLATSQITTDRIRLSWQAVTGASQYDLRRGSLNLDPVTTTSYQFTGLSADTSYSLQVRTRDAWGASAWSSVTETTLPEAPDKPTNLGVTATKNSLTLSWDSASRATGYQVRINSGSGTPPNQPPRRHRFTGLSANTSYTLAVQATNRGGASGWAQITIKTKPAPVTLAASVSPTSCEPGESVTVTWTAGGGSGSYRVTVNGSTRTGGSAKLTCQETAGQQTITVVATDTRHTELSAAVNLSVTVTAPPTVTGQVAARVLSSGKIEFAFRPQGGSRILPTSRIYTPDTTKLNRWTSSSEVRGRAGTESNRLFGKISIKHVKTTSSYYVDVCFQPAGASARVCPSSNNFYYLGATTNKWLYTDSFSFTPRRVSALSADSARAGSQDGQMEAATASEDQAPGTEGGLMSDQE